MNDLEHDIRAALDEQASLAPSPHEPGPAVARARRRRAVTTASSALGLAAIAVLTIVAARAIRTPDDGTPAVPSVTTTVTPVPTPSSEAPEPAQLEHGGTAWGVYLAVSERSDDPALGAAKADAGALGYQAGSGEIACDRPAAQTIGVPSDAFTVALYFNTRADAEAAAALFDRPPVGIAKVTTFCLD